MEKRLSELMDSLTATEKQIAEETPDTAVPTGSPIPLQRTKSPMDDRSDVDPNHKLEQAKEEYDEPPNLRRNDLSEEIKLVEEAVKRLSPYVLESSDPDAFMIYRTLKRLLIDMKTKENAAAVDMEQERYNHESQQRYGMKRTAMFPVGTKVEFEHNGEIWEGTVIGTEGPLLLVDHEETEAAGLMRVDPYSVVGADEPSDLSGEAQLDATRGQQPVDMRANSQHTPTDSEPKSSIGALEQEAPMKSQKQRSYLWATNPELAREFEDKTPKGKKLPKYAVLDMQGQDIDVHDVVEWEGKNVEVVDVMESGNIMISYEDKLIGVHPQETVKVGFYKKSEKLISFADAKRLAYDIGDGADIKDKVEQFRAKKRNGSRIASISDMLDDDVKEQIRYMKERKKNGYDINEQDLQDLKDELKKRNGSKVADWRGEEPKKPEREAEDYVVGDRVMFSSDIDEFNTAQVGEITVVHGDGNYNVKNENGEELTIGENEIMRRVAIKQTAGFETYNGGPLKPGDFIEYKGDMEMKGTVSKVDGDWVTIEPDDRNNYRGDQVHKSSIFGIYKKASKRTAEKKILFRGKEYLIDQDLGNGSYIFSTEDHTKLEYANGWVAFTNGRILGEGQIVEASKRTASGEDELEEMKNDWINSGMSEDSSDPENPFRFKTRQEIEQFNLPFTKKDLKSRNPVLREMAKEHFETASKRTASFEVGDKVKMIEDPDEEVAKVIKVVSDSAIWIEWPNGSQDARHPDEFIKVASMKRTANDKLMKHLDFDDIALGIEWPKDSLRQYSDGFKQHMKCDYGFVRNSLGADGEDLDVYVGDPSTLKVHRIQQLKPETGEHDEYKYMLGFPDVKSAVSMYLQHMPLEHFGGCEEMSLDDFRKTCRTGEQREDISSMEMGV